MSSTKCTQDTKMVQSSGINLGYGCWTGQPLTNHGCALRTGARYEYISWIQIEHLEKLCFLLVENCVDKPTIHCCSHRILRIQLCLTLLHSKQRTWRIHTVCHCPWMAQTPLSWDGFEGIQLDVVGHTEAHFSYPAHCVCETANGNKRDMLKLLQTRLDNMPIKWDIWSKQRWVLTMT